MIPRIGKTLVRVNPKRRSSGGLVVADVFARLVSSSGTYAATYTGYHLIFGWGGGGNGGSSAGTNASGGGSAAAGFTRIWLVAGQTVTWSVGNYGVDTVVTLPNGRVMTAGKGSNGDAGYAEAGNGGVATGWDINRNGYRGGGWNNVDGNVNTNDAGSYGPSGPTGGSYFGASATGAPNGAPAPGMDDLRQEWDLPEFDFTGITGPQWASWNVNLGGTTQGPGCGGYGKGSSGTGFEGRPGQLLMFAMQKA